MGESAHERAEERNQLSALIAFIATAVVCITGITIYAIQSGSFWSVFGVALTIAGAALLTGALFGFLFGIPRTLQHDRPVVPAPNPKTGSQPYDDSSGTSYAVNTNLEQISDWLTKILVGVGLTQIGEMPRALDILANYLAPGVRGANLSIEISKVFAIALFIYSLICGFFVGYLWTRLFLAGAFKVADLTGIEARLHEVEAQVTQQQAPAPSWDSTGQPAKSAEADTVVKRE